MRVRENVNGSEQAHYIHGELGTHNLLVMDAVGNPRDTTTERRILDSLHPDMHRLLASVTERHEPMRYEDIINCVPAHRDSLQAELRRKPDEQIPHTQLPGILGKIHAFYGHEPRYELEDHAKRPDARNEIIITLLQTIEDHARTKARNLKSKPMNAHYRRRRQKRMEQDDEGLFSEDTPAPINDDHCITINDRRYFGLQNTLYELMKIGYISAVERQSLAQIVQQKEGGAILVRDNGSYVTQECRDGLMKIMGSHIASDRLGVYPLTIDMMVEEGKLTPAFPGTKDFVLAEDVLYLERSMTPEERDQYCFRTRDSVMGEREHNFTHRTTLDEQDLN